jgi:hypothetical protein
VGNYKCGTAVNRGKSLALEQSSMLLPCAGKVFPGSPASSEFAMLEPSSDLHAVMAKDSRGVPLGMHRMNPECLDSDLSGVSITPTILVREEPDDDDEDEEEHDGGGEDEGGDEGYSE